METAGPSSAGSIYTHKRIEFRPARRHYTGLGGVKGGVGCEGSFRIETLKPDPGRKRAASEAGLDNCPGSKRGGEGPDFGESLLDLELGFGVAVSKIRKIGAGLENLGNTCYLNSVLQCLTYTEPLAAYLQSGKHQSSCHVAGFCALCAIQKHVSRALESSGRSLVPKDLVSNLRCISRNFRNARQEDAHEYMVNLLESMHKCCLPSGVPYESPAAYEKSLVHKIFGGSLRSQVECQQCFYRSDKFDPFLDLSLEIFRADSVLLALRNFTASELLDGGAKEYQCQRCRDKVKAKKRLTVHKAPYVLSVHLKRFHAHDPGRKVDRKIVFDNSLNLKPFCSGSYEGDLKYSLYGVLVHFGHNTHSGHYVCFIRTSSGIWYLLNDNEVRPVSEKTVLDQKAYMLFYVRDRKNVPLQKPADIIKKENAKAIETMLFRQLTKDQRRCVSIETTANAAVLSTKAKKLNTNLPKGFTQEASIRVGSLSDGTKLDTDPGLKPSHESMSKHLPDSSMLKAESDVKPSSISTSNDQACPPSLSVNNNHHPSPPRASVSCRLHVATSSTESRATELPMVSSSSNASLCLAVMSNQTSQMIDEVLPVMVPGEVPAKDTTNAATEDAKRISDWEASYGAATLFTNLRPATPLSGDSYCLPELSTLGRPKETSNCEASDSKTCSNSRKKLRRLPITGLRLGVGLFRSSLEIQKRKQHMKFKCNSVQVKALVRESSVDDSGCFQFKQAQSKSGLKESNSSRESLCVIPDISGEVQMEDNLKAAEVAVNKKCKKGIIATSEDTLQVAKQRDCTNDSKEIVKRLTRGLEETKVARWDDVELPPIAVSDTNSSRVKSIGYIPDEWDEDYDQGKRKKVKQFKREFGGPSPFQEIASTKPGGKSDEEKKRRQFKGKFGQKSRGQMDEVHDQGKRKKMRQFKHKKFASKKTKSATANSLR